MPATLEPEKTDERRERTRDALRESARANHQAEVFQRRLRELQKVSKERARRADLVLRRARLLK
jgi:hypothetical protein